MHHIQKHPLLGEHIIYAKGRKSRPFQQGGCPFCVGSAEIGSDFDEIMFLPNKYPALKLDDASAGHGICDVILYSSDHQLKLADFSSERMENLIRQWIERSSQLKEQDLKFTFIFENHGKGIGVSMDHPHGQLFSFPFIPKIIEEKLEALGKECLYCTHNNLSLVKSFDHAFLAVPEFIKWPFELQITTTRHISKLEELNDAEIVDMAQSIRYALHMIQLRAGRSTPYILSVYQTYNQDTSGKFHLHLELISPQITKNRIKFRGAVETALGVFINSVTPQDLVDEIETENQFLDDIIAVFSPGRINIIGEHVDHQGGLVLPACIQLGITIYSKKRNDGRTLVFSEIMNHSYEMKDDVPNTRWQGYIYHTIKNFESTHRLSISANIHISSTLPKGAGLSSSAALIVGLLKSLSLLYGVELDNWALIRSAHDIENRDIGLKCGIMDHAAIVLGKENSGLLLDCNNLQHKNIGLDVEYLIINTGKFRELHGSEYNKRIHELERAQQIISEVYNKPIRCLEPSELDDIDEKLGKVLFSRVKHVIDEMKRVREYADLSIQGKMDEAGRLLYLSHDSLKNNFDASWKEADQIVALCRTLPYVHGARMIGAGWGGSVIIQINSEDINIFKTEFQKQESSKFYSITNVRIGAGIHQIEPYPTPATSKFLKDQF